MGSHIENSGISKPASRKRRHKVTQGELAHVNEWNGLLWLDFLNGDTSHARAILDAEEAEILEYDDKDDCTVEESIKKDQAGSTDCKVEIKHQAEHANEFNRQLCRDQEKSIAKDAKASDQQLELQKSENSKTSDGDEGLGADTYEDRDPESLEDGVGNTKDTCDKGTYVAETRWPFVAQKHNIVQPGNAFICLN